MLGLSFLVGAEHEKASSNKRSRIPITAGVFSMFGSRTAVRFPAVRHLKACHIQETNSLFRHIILYNSCIMVPLNTQNPLKILGKL
jgi:hypothetical protein